MDQERPYGVSFFVPIYYSDNNIMAFILPTHEIRAGSEGNKSKYNIAHQLLFQTPLFEIHIDDIDNRKLEKNIYKLRDKSKGVLLSNRGGWHSDIQSSYPKNGHQIDDTFKPVIDKIVEIIDSLPFEPVLSTLDDISIWANINGKGSYNTIHNHPNCDLAGVYYVKVPEGNCGNIAFHDNRPRLFGNSLIVERYVGGSLVPRYPVEGNMYLFPSSLDHDVDINNVDEDRISISFNLIVR
tara:strand:- start:59 stop:775 length:717 start_codon:yes stop_codon:yes gene_type:complete